MAKKNFQGQLIILSGPSCTGKTPLKKAFAHFFPDLYRDLKPLILLNSRKPRPGEKNGVDFLFRDYHQINQLHTDKNYTVINVHNDLQAIDKKELRQLLKNNNVLYEGNTLVGRSLQTEPDLKDINKKCIFLSPFAARDILNLKQKSSSTFRNRIENIMQKKIMRRANHLEIKKDKYFIKDTLRRAADAYLELKEAWRFDHIIPNHDGEDSDHWYASVYPKGAAGEALDAFVAILLNKSHSIIEKWDENLVP